METVKKGHKPSPIPGFWTSYEGWKLHSRPAFSPTISRFWTSYEGWKLGLWCLADREGRVFELPMRDGNASRSVFFRNFSFVFELPMRDGNPDSSWPFRRRISSFWTSYEGWKHTNDACSLSAAAEFLNFLWGMETDKRQFNSDDSAGFWTSYEGWKPEPSRLKHIANMVFELPMRDGNPIPRALCQFESVVFELPMRDGNLLSENLPITNEDRFWTSYEGWKL